jgi:hypothetical protein
LEFALSSLDVASDEQYKSVTDDEIALVVRKFCALHKFRKERRRSPRGCFKCGDTTPSLIAPRGRRLTPPRSMTTPTGMTMATRARTRRRTASETTTRRRSYRISYPKRVPYGQQEPLRRLQLLE